MLVQISTSRNNNLREDKGCRRLLCSPVFVVMGSMIFKQRVKLMLLAVVVLISALIWAGTSPRIFLQGETRMIASVPAHKGSTITINFIHSVQKTPVEENLVIGSDVSHLILRSTRYHSFGVGLPFMESDGKFYQDGNDFVMDDMNRQFSSLSLRTGLGTKLTVTVDGEVYPLYEWFEPGYKVDIFVAPSIYYFESLIQEL